MTSAQGLTTEDVQQLREQFGANVLPQSRTPGLVEMVVRQFLSPLIYVLLAAGIVSLALGEISDAVFIFIVLVINAAIGAAQEFSAQKAANALQQMVPVHATVIRSGKQFQLDAEELVPGDLVLLESGDKVPADIRLLDAQSLTIDESLLTGESVAVTKDHRVTVAEDSPIGDRLNHAFAGTMVTRGRGRGEVSAIGVQTELGKIASSLSAPELAKPPLLVRIERFTWRISVAMLGLILLLFAEALWRGEDLTAMFLMAVGLAVAAIPEGLPAAITVALAIGMRRMAERHVIIRKLLAVESLGSCTLIASDKTGTLTVNRLTATRIALPGGGLYEATGEGMVTEGVIRLLEGAAASPESLTRLCRAGVLSNEAILHPDGKHHGDMVDIAFLVLGRKCGLDRNALLESYPEVGRVPYESENGFSAALHRCGDGNRIFVKGSTEFLLSRCSDMATLDGIHPLDRDAVFAQMESLADSGYRVLAVAEGPAHTDTADENLHDLTFLGLIGMIDPLRPEARESVAECHRAGIEVAMITGDHPVTARAIARELGLSGTDHSVVTGDDLRTAQEQGEDAVDTLIRGSRVFARISPVQKQCIVETLIRQGQFVAVTGDGVNDAPALRHAHVGVAMGKRGTDVARESADVIITDDNFASLVQGVAVGRMVYANIRKVIFLLISTGGGELVLFLLAMLAGLPMPLLAAQLLWLNLVTNGVQDVALALEPSEGDELRQPPRAPQEPIFNRLMLTRVGLSALVIGGLSFALYFALLSQGYTEAQARNFTLWLMVLFENIHVFNSRSETRSIFHQPFWSNPVLLVSVVVAHALHLSTAYIPGLNTVLGVEPISLTEWSILLLIAFLLLMVGELHKWWVRRRAA